MHRAILNSIINSSSKKGIKFLKNLVLNGLQKEHLFNSIRAETRQRSDLSWVPVVKSLLFPPILRMCVTDYKSAMSIDVGVKNKL